MSVTTEDFRRELRSRFAVATNGGKSQIEITASELHKSLGASQRHVLCCNAMKCYFDEALGDEILDTPPSGFGGRLRIRYVLPKDLVQKESSKKAMPRPMAKKSKLLRGRADDLINTFETCLDYFCAEQVFTGPCVYFHEKAIQIRNSYPTALATLADECFFDAVYATLTSWGMHRLGSGGAKLRDLPEIRQSFLDLSVDIEKLQHLRISEIPDEEVEATGKKIRYLIENLKVGANSTVLVAGTKALHHLLPALCPPVDRSYTLRFFYGSTQISRNEGVIFEEIFSELHHIARSCKELIARRLIEPQGMNSCESKIIDNAIVGYMKKHYGKEVTLEEDSEAN